MFLGGKSPRNQDGRPGSGMRNVRMKRYEKLIIYPYFLLINFPFSSVSVLFFLSI